jgi:sugar phosphate isomerase/epimerase
MPERTRVRWAYDDIGWSPDGSRQPEAMAEIAAAGFKGFETISQRIKSYLDDPDGAEKYQALLDAHGLRLVCTTGANEQVARFAQKLGVKALMTGSGPRAKADEPEREFGDLVARLNDQGRLVADYGIKLGMHTTVWSRVARPEEISAVLDQTDPRYVGFIPDIGQITLGGGDPVELCRRYVDRIVHVHLSDTEPQYRSGKGGHFYYTYQDAIVGHHMRDLGTGGVDIPALIDALEAGGYDGWVTIETYLPLGSARESCQANRRYVEEVLGRPIA